MKKITAPKTPAIALPEGIIASDLEYPRHTPRGRGFARWYEENRIASTFEIWYVPDWGWCIPTLQIRHAGATAREHGKQQDRSYAVRISDSSVCRIGWGPHVTAMHTVYVKACRLPNLQKYLDIRTAGESAAGTIRDRISTRRAQTALRRAAYGSWF